MLDDLAALGPFFAVSSHRPGAVPVLPWRPVSELTGEPGPLQDRIASVRSALAARGDRAVGEVELRVAASALHLGLVARLIAPALGAAVLGRPIDMSPGGLWWRDETGGPVPLSVPAPDPGCDPAPAGWDQRLLDEVIAPVTSATARLARVSGRVLWGNVSSAVNVAAVQISRQRPDLTRETWQAAGDLFARPPLCLERQPPGPAFRRSSCCLFYRLAPDAPSAICGDCILGGPRAR